MYESPIEMLISDIQHQLAQQQDEEVYKAVISVGINVDKEELLRALQYDRFQYDKGYADGHRDAMDKLVRCKDCTFCKVDNSVYMRDVFGNENDTPQYHCLMGYGYNKPDHFCSYGERREGE